MRYSFHLPAFLPALSSFSAFSMLLSACALMAIAPAARAQVQEFDFQEFQFDQQMQPGAQPGVQPSIQPGAPEQNAPLDTPANLAFYAGARRLIQEQINLASRTRKAMTTVDPNAIRAVDGQIVLHGTKINRFIAENYRITPPNCEGTATLASLAAQDQIACNLLANANAFDGLQDRLFSRLNMLSGIAEVNRLPLVSGERVVTNSGVPLFMKGSFKTPSPTIITKAPDIPTPPNGVLGQPVKSALGDYRAPISPAIAAPPDVVTTLSAIEGRLDETRSLFLSGSQSLSRQPAPVPQAAQTLVAAQSQPQNQPQAQAQPRGRRYPALARGFTNPDAILARADAAAYDVRPTDRLAHQQFLTNPHTGITQVLTRREHVPDG